MTDKIKRYFLFKTANVPPNFNHYFVNGEELVSLGFDQYHAEQLLRDHYQIDFDLIFIKSFDQEIPLKDNEK